MKISMHIYEGIANLRSSKLRSLLALLGILVGTASVVGMISGGELAEYESLKQFKSLGTELLAVNIKEEKEGKNTKDHEMDESLSIKAATLLHQTHKDIDVVAPYTQVYYPIQFSTTEINGTTLGVNAEFSKIFHITLEKGRFISNLDGYNFYCVIGHNIYNQIKKMSLKNPIGQQIQIGNYIFTIIGVISSWPESNFLDANIDESLLIPIAASVIMSKYTAINNIILRLNVNANIDEVQKSVENYLHNHLPNNSFLFRNAKELIASMARQTEIFTIFLGLIGGISLLVGGIGVMNIMLVSIVERQREIGIRLAVGATRTDIRYLFLIEAIILSLIGGTLGATLGIFISYMLAFFWNWSFTFFILPPLVGFSVSAATGIIFGYYPAYKASLLDPIESLRSV